MYFIYAIRHKVNGKEYVGRTGREVATRVKEHANEGDESLIGKAIAHFGGNSFSYRILETCYNYDYHLQRERYWIDTLNTVHPNGYNKE